MARVKGLSAHGQGFLVGQYGPGRAEGEFLLMD